MRKPGITAALAVSALFLICLPAIAVAKTEKPIKLSFKVKDGELILKRWGTSSSNCTKQKHEGCYELPNNYYGHFELKLSGADNYCNNEDKWKFHKVTLGGESDVNDPGPKPGEDDWGDISEGLATDYGANRDSGEVGLTVDSTTKVTFRAENNYPSSVWYKVSVATCRTDENGDPVQILEYDPRVDNRGRPTG